MHDMCKASGRVVATGQRGGAALRDVPLHQRVRGDGRGARQGHRRRLMRAQRRHLHPRQAPPPEPLILRRPGRPARRQVVVQYCDRRAELKHLIKRNRHYQAH